MLDPHVTRRIAGVVLVFAGSGGIYFAIGFALDVVAMATYADVTEVALLTAGTFVFSSALLVLGAWALWKEFGPRRPAR